MVFFAVTYTITMLSDPLVGRTSALHQGITIIRAVVEIVFKANYEVM